MADDDEKRDEVLKRLLKTPPKPRGQEPRRKDNKDAQTQTKSLKSNEES